MSDDDEREKYPSELADRFQVRMPNGLRDAIKEAAEKNNRSMNAEILARLSGSWNDRQMGLDLLRAAAKIHEFNIASMENHKSILDAAVNASLELQKLGIGASAESTAEVVTEFMETLSKLLNSIPRPPADDLAAKLTETGKRLLETSDGHP